MTPTIGRIVHYRPSDEERKAHGPAFVPAIITAVWSPVCVNLQVFWLNSPVSVVPSVSYAEYGMQPEPRTWFWPPRV